MLVPIRVMLPVAVQVPVTGSYSSALFRYVAGQAALYETCRRHQHLAVSTGLPHECVAEPACRPSLSMSPLPVVQLGAVQTCRSHTACHQYFAV